LQIDIKAHLIIGMNLSSELRAYDFNNGVQKHSFNFKGDLIHISSLGIFKFDDAENSQSSKSALILNWVIDWIPEIDGNEVHLIAVVDKTNL